MRNAIVQAAWTQHGSDDWEPLWNVFATRGMGWWASTEGPDDTSPEPNFDPTEDTPSNPSSRGTVTGRVLAEGGAPVAGATVAVAGHDSGIPGVTQLSSPTDANGRYTLAGVPSGQYPDLYASKAGYAQPTTALSVAGRRHDREGLQPVPARLGVAHLRRLGHRPTGRTSPRTAAARPRRSTTTRTRSGARPRTRARTTS